MKNEFELEHIGINTPNKDEALKLAELLSLVFNLNPRHGQKSEFAGDYFECLKEPYLGTNGHIAMRTKDLTAAMKELEEKGFKFGATEGNSNESQKAKKSIPTKRWNRFNSF